MKAHNQKLGKMKYLFGAGCCLSLSTPLIQASQGSHCPSVPAQCQGGCLLCTEAQLQHSASPNPMPGHCTEPSHESVFPQEPHMLHSGISSVQGHLLADGAQNTRGSYLRCSRTPTFSFRQEVKFTIDWTHHKLLIITIISE